MVSCHSILEQWLKHSAVTLDLKFFWVWFSHLHQKMNKLESHYRLALATLVEKEGPNIHLIPSSCSLERGEDGHPPGSMDRGIPWCSEK